MYEAESCPLSHLFRASPTLRSTFCNGPCGNWAQGLPHAERVWYHYTNHHQPTRVPDLVALFGILLCRFRHAFGPQTELWCHGAVVSIHFRACPQTFHCLRGIGLPCDSLVFLCFHSSFVGFLCWPTTWFCWAFLGCGTAPWADVVSPPSTFLVHLFFSCMICFPCISLGVSCMKLNPAHFLIFSVRLLHSAQHFVMDHVGIEPRASRMLSGCDTTTPITISRQGCLTSFLFLASCCVLLGMLLVHRLSSGATAPWSDLIWPPSSFWHPAVSF